MVDNVIETIWEKSRPGYLFLPCDLPEMKVPVERLYSSLNLSYDIVDKQELNETTKKILEMLYEAKNPAIIVDAFVGKLRLEGELAELIRLLDGKVNLYDTFLGKGLLDENDERFVGTYCGFLTQDGVAKSVESSDFVLHLGEFENEVNSGFFSYKLNNDKLIHLGPDHIQIGHTVYEQQSLQTVLPNLIEQLDPSKITPAPYYQIEPFSLPTDTSFKMTEHDLFNTIQDTLRPGDILIVETCSFIFSCYDMKLSGAKFLNQMHWGAIGYALPATLGASLALKDFNLPGKVISVEGDGSAQMTLQELSSILRYDVNPVLIILNNSGYTIERVIEGPNRSYNDISGNWQWTQMLRCFGDLSGERSQSYKISSRKQLDLLMKSEQFHSLEKFQLIELVLPKFDIPKRLREMLDSAPK
ncbi:unnamed protein product [Ambrosiozyma monospora]|uniref:Unnamed protein product n=1 Tax=Ambrosiozyma monospora TaxID=43982 RepID=A0ACB5T9Y7_AMBMO|nr:unnamed protein product [Ambrosiozyma monospora]